MNNIIKIVGLVLTCVVGSSVDAANKAPKQYRQTALSVWTQEKHQSVCSPFSITKLNQALASQDPRDLARLLRAGGDAAKQYCMVRGHEIWNAVLKSQNYGLIPALIDWKVSGVNHCKLGASLKSTPLGMVLLDKDGIPSVQMEGLMALLRHPGLNVSIRCDDGKTLDEVLDEANDVLRDENVSNAVKLVRQHRNAALNAAIIAQEYCILCGKNIDKTAITLSCDFNHRFHGACLRHHLFNNNLSRCLHCSCRKVISAGDRAAIARQLADLRQNSYRS